MRNKNLSHDYDIAISIVVESEDIEEVEDYANALMDSIRGEADVVNADWYYITPIRKHRPKRKDK